MHRSVFFMLMLFFISGPCARIQAQKPEPGGVPRFTAWVRFLEEPELAKNGEKENPWSFVKLRITAFVKGESDLRTIDAYQLLYPHSMYRPRVGDSLCVTFIKSPTLVESRRSLGEKSPWKGDYLIDPSDDECYRATNPKWTN